MIPKKIHYTWFSDEPFPDKINECLESWHKSMPEYEFIHWDSKRIANIDSIFLKEAIKAKKWAFAADFVRLWALYNEGGLYLDTDVMCFKSFDDLLDKNNCFIGKESSIHVTGRITEQYLTSHCMAAVSHHPFIKLCLDYYIGRHFIQSENEQLPVTLRYDMTLLPYIQSEVAKTFGYSAYPSVSGIQYLKDDTIVYPASYFDPGVVDDLSYCKHLAVGSWRESRAPQEALTLSYKIRWRIENLVKKMLNKHGYMMVKKL